MQTQFDCGGSDGPTLISESLPVSDQISTSWTLMFPNLLKPETGNSSLPGSAHLPSLHIRTRLSPIHLLHVPALVVSTGTFSIQGPEVTATELGLRLDWTYVPTMGTLLDPEAITYLDTIMSGLFAALLPYLLNGWSKEQANVYRNHPVVRRNMSLLAKVVETISSQGTLEGSGG